LGGENVEEDVPELNEIYDILLKDGISIAQGLAGSVRHFLYFCASLAVFCIIFAAVGVYFFVANNLSAAISSFAMALIVAFYSFVLWKDYSKMRNRFSALFEARKRLEEKLKALEEKGKSE